MVTQVIAMAQKGKVTLLYGAKDPLYNQAVVLCEEIKRRLADKNKRCVLAPFYITYRKMDRKWAKLPNKIKM